MRKLVLRPSARDDLKSIFNWIEQQSGANTARAYVQRIRNRYLALGDFPDSGSPRDDLVAGLRTISFERRAMICYMVNADEIVVLRILHKGRDIDTELGS